MPSPAKSPLDLKLAERIRTALELTPGITERKMFGGICFMLDQKMLAGLVGPTLMLRVGPDQHVELLKKPHTREMDFTGRPMKGFLYVDPPGIKTAAALSAWLDRAMTYVAALPAKKAKPAKPRAFPKLKAKRR